MKNLLKIASIIGLTVITQTAYSAAVTDTFETGDTLTAAQLNNIKAAVNDNDTRISDIAQTPGPVVVNRAPTTDDDVNASYSVGTVWIDTSTTTLYVLEDNTANAAVWTIAAAPAVTYALGDTGPAGGFVFYITADGLHGLEAAPSDQDTGTGIRWYNDSYTDTSAIGDGVGAGAMNTMLIIANQGADSTTYAAGIADNLVIKHLNVDYGDWYLPSKYELNLMWKNLADPNEDGRGAALDGDSVGGFASVGPGYWSSSQSNFNYAWFQYFANGNQFGNFDIYDTLRVRAVRAF
jgi:hypothetical protein